MSQPAATPETDAIRKLTMAGHWNLTEKGGLLEHLESFERQRDAARDDARRLAALLDEPMRISGMDWPPSGWTGAACSALAAHVALTTKK